MIENARIEEVIQRGMLKAYKIYPLEGYKLHEKSRDEEVFDDDGNPTGGIKKGYTEGVVTAMANYDFEGNPREIYAVEVTKIENDT